MHVSSCGAVQAERQGDTRQAAGVCLRGGPGRCGYELAGANDHRVNRVKSDGEQHPEDGRQEKAAHHLAYGMGFEEAG